ncbi:MAG: phosphatase PAP2 family protein [Bacteroidota bacterium]
MFTRTTAWLFCLIVCLQLMACNTGQPAADQAVEADDLHTWNEVLEAAIVNDFFTPPVAGRIYVYPNIAAYEVLAAEQQGFPSLVGHVHELTAIPASEQAAHPSVAALFAFYHTARNLVYAVDTLDAYRDHFRNALRERGFDAAQVDAAETYGKTVAKHILQWANSDNYPQMRSMDQYQLKETPGSWKPTPPDYLEAMEPHWPKLRAFTLDSAAQFRPAPPTAYDMDTTSVFYAELLEVYGTLKNNSPETEAIAKFWDCNPLVRKHQGHVTYAEKKLTPGGHWVNIARSAMQREKQPLMEASRTYALLCVGIADAFISCWDEKYRSNYIRPVTVVHAHLDPEWHPILYTPNFPEYPSGHSVVSGSAATILTALFGEHYAFIDSTEVPYGIAPRAFDSFYAASEEAAISRLYGGIHFMPAIENGKTQGRAVGTHVLQSLSPKATP